MKSFLKKTSAFVLIFSSVAIAAGLITKDQVNQKVAALTAPYINENTALSLEFTDLNVDAVRALDFGINAFLSKKGTANELVLKLSNAAYHYGDGVKPTVTGDLTLQLDLVKAFGQKTLNDAAQDFEEILKNMSAEYTQKYGAAVTVEAKVLELIKDANGDVESAKIRMGAVIDFSKLPATLTPADVEFQSFQAELGIGKTGVSGRLNLVMNPQNKSFAADQPGLKEMIEQLLNDDQKAFDDINQLIQLLDGFADSIVNQDPPAPQP